MSDSIGLLRPSLGDQESRSSLVEHPRQPAGHAVLERHVSGSGPPLDSVHRVACGLPGWFGGRRQDETEGGVPRLGVVNASFDPATEDPNREVGRPIEVEPD